MFIAGHIDEEKKVMAFQSIRKYIIFSNLNLTDFYLLNFFSILCLSSLSGFKKRKFKFYMKNMLSSRIDPKLICD